jgi:Anti-sigma-K factor rskA
MMQQQVKEAPIEAAAQLRPPSAPETVAHRRDPAGLWRAVAGMAISVALACLIVTLEFTSQATHRADRMHRRAQALFSRASRLQAEVAAERARIAAAHRELAAAEALRALLRAPDASMLLLSPPAAGGHGAVAAQGPEATLALGLREHRAVLMVTGLKASANGTVFVLWWSAPHGAPIRAAEFRTAGDGSALVTAALPAGLSVAAAMVTAERAARSSAAKAGKAPAQTGPSGPVQLRGVLSR